jgi:TldD protein
MIDDSTACELLGILSASDARFFEIFAEHSVRTEGLLDSQKIGNMCIGLDAGVGLRLIKGQRTAYAYINSFDRHLLRNCAKQLADAFKGKKPYRDFNLNYSSADIDRSNTKALHRENDVDNISNVLHSLDRAARSSSGLIKQVTARYAGVEQQIFIANSDGVAVEDVRTRSRHDINVIAQISGNTQTGYESAAATVDRGHLRQTNLSNLARTAARRAVDMLSAKPAPAGKMMVVLSGKAGGTMIHEACGHGLEADFIHRGVSCFADRLNQQVASPLITVVDDGSLAHRYGFMNVDDEGTKTRKNVLIAGGILKTFMTDRLHASLLDIPLTGNARRESYRNKPVPRMTNTYIGPGHSKLADIITSVEQGLLVVKIEGGQVNPVNGDFVFKITEGYLLKKGRIQEAVRGAILSGNGPEVLRTIDMVANDLSFMPGLCGKEDEVPVGHGQPTIRIPDLLVGGQSS